MKASLPPAVYDAVSEHLRQSGRRAHRDWEVNQADEDSLTGAAFASFRTRRTRRVYINGQEWLWRVRTRKFGKRSEEKPTGADGIIEIEIKHAATGQVEGKGLLVQAKKKWLAKNAKLVEQIHEMEHLAPGASAAIDYSPTGYSGIDGRAVLAADGNRRHVENAEDVPLGDFLADRFLSCEVGLREAIL